MKKIVAVEREKRKELESFSSIFEGAEMTANTDLKASTDESAAQEFEEDFM